MRRAAVLLVALGLSTFSLRGEGVAANTNENASAWQMAQSHTTDLVRKTLQNEIASSQNNRASIRYRLNKTSNNSRTVKEIVETRDGGVARLLSRNGKPLSADEERDEIQRLKDLDRDPSIQAHRRREENRDVERMRKFMRLLPEAFLFKYKGPVKTAAGTWIALTFTPNPKFSPPDFETRIMIGIRGEIWIDPAELRVVRVSGTTFRQVDFGWGILGTLYPGAILMIEQTHTPECGWQLSHLKLHLLGKELMFKSLHIELEETGADYQPIPQNWTYHDAVHWLLQLPPDGGAAVQ